MRRALLVVGLLLLAAPAAHASPRPGPPLLHAPAPHVPQLENKAPFRAEPLLVSGTDAYRDGEYLYQDYLFDDHGADKGTGILPPGVGSFSPASGDALYPDKATYANNAADLVELRIKPTSNAIVYRVTLGTVLGPKAAAVGIGIDTDRSGGKQVQWPNAARISSPGIDRFILAWGTRGKLLRPNGTGTFLPRGAVKIDLRTNQMTIRVPRSLMNPGRKTWRYVAATGLAAGAGFATPFPGILNLAFRFDEGQPRGQGTWFEADQAKALAGGTSGRFHADVDFAKLAAGVNRWIHAPGRKQARIYPSRLNVPEGVRRSFPEFGGRLQPYLVFVPKSYRRTHRAGITFALHSLSATYTQYAVFSPNQPQQLGDDEGRFYVSPLGRGPDGWYTDEAEVDFFEVWADLARHFRVDPNHVALSGYSMGGYGTYKLGLQWPDLFGAAFTTVGPPVAPGYLNTRQLIENARWLPYLNWAGRTDMSVPIGLVRAQQQRFDDLGLRSQLWTYPGGHLNLAAGDRWEGARAFLAGSTVTRNPRRVDYVFVPQADNRRLGLVHDHAYWVSGLRARTQARAQISALGSRASDPVVERIDSWNGKPPEPESVTGSDWTGTGNVRPANQLGLMLANVSRARIDGAGAGLTGKRCVHVSISSDGPARVALDLRLPAGAIARKGNACSRSAPAAGNVSVRRGGATFRSAGTWVILP